MKKLSSTMMILLLVLTSITVAQTDNQITTFKKYSEALDKYAVSNLPGLNTKTQDKENTRSFTYNKVLDNGYVVSTVITQLGGGGNWTNFESESYTYDTEFNPVEYLTQVWGGNNWINELRLLQTFTPANLLKTKLSQLWNGTDWDDDMKIEYEYNPENKTSQVTFFSVVQNGVYEEVSRELHTYSENPYTEITETQQKNNGVWENLSKMIVVFVNDEKIGEQTIFGWSGSAYVESDKTVFTYENNLLIQSTNLRWNAAQWDSVAMHSYQYNASGKMTQFMSRQYDPVTQTWNNVFKGETTYWGSDSTMSVIQQGTENNGWENLFKTHAHYNVSGDITSTVYWDWTAGEWIPGAMSELFYDEHGNNIEYVEKAYDNGQWVNIGRVLQTFIPTNPTGVDDDPILANEYKLYENYPNPFNPSTTIQYHLPTESIVSVKVFDVTGSEVTELISAVQNSGLQKITFDANNLSSGVYFYVVNAKSIDGKNSFSETKKMLMIK